MQQIPPGIYHKIIPPQLRTQALRFIKLRRRDKRPVDSNYYETKNYPGNDSTITDHVDRGGNYGIFPRDEGICILDIDDVEHAERLGLLDLFIEQFKTFIVKTGGGGLHIYFRCPEMVTEMGIPRRIPLFDRRDTTRHIGEIYPTGCRAYVVGPGSIHPSGEQYTVMQDVPIADVPLELVIDSVFSKVNHTPWDGIEDGYFDTNSTITDELNQLEKTIPVKQYRTLLADEIGIRIEDVALPINGIRRGTEIQGTHPVHGSTTGFNFSICTKNNLWHCYRCNSGGDPITWIAVREGFIECCEAGQNPISGDLFLQVREALITKYGYENQIAEIDQRWNDVQTKRQAQNIERTVTTENPVHQSRELGTKFVSHLSQNNIIERYVTTAKKMTDAYPEFHYAAAYSLLSMITNRCAVVKMSHGDIYSNIWTLCLGISTIARKSTALKIGRDIARYHDAESELPSSFTPESLIEELTDNSRVWWIKDEIGTLLSSMQKKQYMADMRDFLNEIYENQDYRRKLRTKRSNVRTEFIISKPYTTFFFATTPETFSEQTSTGDLTSGWLLRFLYFYPQYYKVSRPYSTASDDTTDEMNHIRSLFGELFALFRLSNEELEFVISRTGLEFFQSWQRDIETIYFNSGDHLSLAQYGRLFSYAIKLAILFKVGDPSFTEEIARTNDGGFIPGQKIVLDEKFLVEACRQIDQYFAPIATEVADMVARQTEINVQEKILALLRRNGGQMKQVEILRALHIKKKDFIEHVSALVDSEEVKIVEYQRPRKKPEIIITLLTH